MPRHNHSARVVNKSPRKHFSSTPISTTDLNPGDVILTRFYGDTIGASKTRPAVLYAIEDDTALVLPVTSDLGPHECKFIELKHYIEAGLVKPCVILGRTRTIDPRTDIIEKLGSLLEAELLEAIELLA